MESDFPAGLFFIFLDERVTDTAHEGVRGINNSLNES